MGKNSVIEKSFFDKVEDGGVCTWGKKREEYKKAKDRFQKYEGRLIALVKPKVSESEYKIFEKALELFKNAIYDIELEEKLFYYKEGHKQGMLLMKELFK